MTVKLFQYKTSLGTSNFITSSFDVAQDKQPHNLICQLRFAKVYDLQ